MSFLPSVSIRTYVLVSEVGPLSLGLLAVGEIVVHDNAYSDIVDDGPAGGSFLSYPGALEVGVEFSDGDELDVSIVTP